MEALQKRLEALEQQTVQLKHHIRITERALRWWRRMTCVLGVLALLAPPLTSVRAQQEGRHADENPWNGLAHRVAQLENEVAQLEDKLVHITSSSDEVTITGANLRIVNGLGSTNTTNGLGNLIVGYNETRGEHSTDTRTGSHNVVVGAQQNFSSFGGLVVGEFNEISGPWNSVTGGTQNTASGISASVSGGIGNTASGRPQSAGGSATPPSAAEAPSAGGSVIRLTPVLVLNSVLLPSVEELPTPLVANSPPSAEGPATRPPATAPPSAGDSATCPAPGRPPSAEGNITRL